MTPSGSLSVPTLKLRWNAQLLFLTKEEHLPPPPPAPGAGDGTDEARSSWENELSDISPGDEVSEIIAGGVEVDNKGPAPENAGPPPPTIGPV